MDEILGTRPFDLEERTFLFAKEVRAFIKKLPGLSSNIEDSKQLIRSSGSIGANYIEANEAISNKDFLFRLRISRKEAKESVFWLKLLKENLGPNTQKEAEVLINEAIELKKILSSMIEKSK